MDHGSMENLPYNYRETLRDYFLVRKEVNPNYSLRSFARDLDLSSSNLCKVLDGTKGLSKDSAERVAECLRMKAGEQELFVTGVMAADARSKKERLLAIKDLAKFDYGERKQLRDDYFKLISNWYYLAILELLNLEQFNSDPKWIASELEIEVIEVSEALKRLTRLKLIEQVDGHYQSTGAHLDTINDIPSVHVKKFHTQALQKATKALLNQDVSKREFQSLTIAINDQDIDFVKEQVRAFKESLAGELSKRADNNGANRVYSFNIQFFDLLKE
jgi:uncharacterized protein (TIGR02147 family)